jgi:hypothetical protein
MKRKALDARARIVIYYGAARSSAHHKRLNKRRGSLGEAAMEKWLDIGAAVLAGAAAVFWFHSA